MVHTPTGNRPRMNGSYAPVPCAAFFLEYSFVCLTFSSVIKNTSPVRCKSCQETVRTRCLTPSAHRKQPRRALSGFSEPPPGGDAVQRLVGRRLTYYLPFVGKVVRTADLWQRVG